MSGRRLLLSGGLLLALASAARADLECVQPVVELGEVKSGLPLAHRFTLVNRGREVIDVIDVHPSCGCLAPRLEKRRLGPGEDAWLLLEVNTLTQPEGPIIWRARVAYQAGNRPGELTLYLSARVRKEITLEPPNLILYTDSAIGHDVTLTDRRDQPLKVLEVRTSPRLRTRLGEPHRDAAGHWARAISVEVPGEMPEGRHEEMLQILTADTTYPEFRVPVTVVKRSRQQVRATPDSVSVSGARGEPLPSRIVQLAAADDQDVTVERVEADDPAVQCRWARGPGHRATLKIQVDGSRVAGDELRARVRVHVSRPAPQTVTVPVTCTLR